MHTTLSILTENLAFLSSPSGNSFRFGRIGTGTIRADPLVRQYQLTLDAVLRDHPGLASCAVHCCRCGIRFLTHPRNANRRDLCCEFGCREHHRRQQANAAEQEALSNGPGTQEQEASQRESQCGSRRRRTSSVARGRPAGHDARGGGDFLFGDVLGGGARSPRTPPPPHPQPAHRGPGDNVDLRCGPRTRSTASAAFGSLRGADVKLVLDGLALDEVTLVNSSLLPYLAMVATVIEGRTIRSTELLQALRKSMRQRSFDRLPRREYVLRFLNQHPP